MVTQVSSATREWAFLLHRLPRLPSAPRLWLWRSLRRLGAQLVSDGLVALPANARTVEHLEWLAAGIRENNGEASVWIAQPTTRATGRQLENDCRAASEAEYRALIREIAVARELPPGEKRRAVRRLRRQIRAIASRDFFNAPSAAQAQAAVDSLAVDVIPTKVPA